MPSLPVQLISVTLTTLYIKMWMSIHTLIVMMIQNATPSPSVNITSHQMFILNTHACKQAPTYAYTNAQMQINSHLLQ